MQKEHLRHAQSCCDSVTNAGPHQVEVLNDATEPHIPGHTRWSPCTTNRSAEKMTCLDRLGVWIWQDARFPCMAQACDTACPEHVALHAVLRIWYNNFTIVHRWHRIIKGKKNQGQKPLQCHNQTIQGQQTCDTSSRHMFVNNCSYNELTAVIKTWV